MYKARQVSVERVVALKVLPIEPAPSPEWLARFLREAKEAMRLDHPDIVRVLATGESDGRAWAALEYVEGTNAKARLKRKGKLALPEAIAIATHVANALDHGWRAARILHGDVEPEVILLSKKSEVKLAGLGFGHGVGEGKPFAGEGAPSGAALYLSPERAEGEKDVDFRADIYSLGCTLFHLISGEPPYPGDTALAVILHHVTKPVPQLTTVRPDCPTEVSRVVMKMMHKLPSGRHQSYEELIDDLRHCYEVISNPPKPAVVAATAAPAQAAVAMPPRESIGMVSAAVPVIAAPAPSRESLKAAVKVRPAAMPEVQPVAAVKVATILPDEDFGRKNESGNGKRRSLVKPLLIAAGILAAGVVAFLCFPGKKGENLSEAQRAERDRALGILPPKPAAPEPPKATIAKPKNPTTPKPTATPEPVSVAAEAPPAATPMPAPAPQEPTPPVPAAPQSATAKWIADQQPQWQAAYEAEVGAEFAKAVAELRAQHLASVEKEIAGLPPTAERDAAAALRAERTRMTAGGDIPEEDESMAPPSLRALRASFRTAFAKLDGERFAKAKVLHARYDAILLRSQAALTQKQRSAEAEEIQAFRDSLRDTWLKPPAGSAAAMAEAKPAEPEPAPVKPIPAAPPAPKLPKLAPRPLVERLLAMGATLSVSLGGAPIPITKIADLTTEKFAIMKIEFAAKDGLTAADLDIIEQLDDVEDLTLTAVPATDATMKILRGLPALRTLTLRDLKDVTPAAFRSVAAIPSLKTLHVRGPIGAESLSALVVNRKLDSLTVSDVTFAEPDFAAIAGIPILKTLTVSSRDPIPPAAWARLVAAKKLATLNLEKTPKTPEMIAHLAKIATLTSLSLGDVALADADLAPLGALKLLGTLKTTADSTLDGGVFASWPLHPAMKTLTLASTSSLSDKALRGIAIAFPNLEKLEIRANSGSVTPAGLTHLQKLKKLTYLQLAGDAIDAAALGHLAAMNQITHLGLGAARLTEAEVRMLGQFASLRELEWLNPPVTDAALKGYAKLRALAQFKVGNKTKPEVLEKLVASLPHVKVTP